MAAAVAVAAVAAAVPAAVAAAAVGAAARAIQSCKALLRQQHLSGTQSRFL